MLLAVDTSTRTIGLALYDGTSVLSEMIWASHDYHTVELAPSVMDMMSRAQVEIEDLSALGVATGPGSFTGLRIGMALVKGIALVRRLPIIGVPTLDILAAAQPRSEHTLAAVLRAGRGRLAVGWYHYQDQGWRSQGDIRVLTAVQLEEVVESTTIVCGELNAEERALLGQRRKITVLASPASCLRRPSVLAEIAWRRWRAGLEDNPASLSPQYVHHRDSIPG